MPSLCACLPPHSSRNNLILAGSPTGASTLRLSRDFVRSGSCLARVVSPRSSSAARQRTITALNKLTPTLPGRTCHRRPPLVPISVNIFPNRWSYSLIRRVRGYTGRVGPLLCGGIPVCLRKRVWGHTGAPTANTAEMRRLLVHLVPCELLRRIAVSAGIVTSPAKEPPAAKKGISIERRSLGPRK